MSKSIGVVEVVAGGIKLFCQSYFHTLVFILPLIIVSALGFLFDEALYEVVPTADDPNHKAATQLGLLFSFGYLILNLFVIVWIYKILNADYKGQPPTWDAANKGSGGRVWKLFLGNITLGFLFLGISAVVSLVVFGPLYLLGMFTKPSSSATVGGADGIGFVADSVSASMGNLQLLMAGGMIVVLIVVFAIFIRFYFFMLSIIIEKHGVFHAISRSFELTKGRVWKTIGVGLLSGLFVLAINVFIAFTFVAIIGATSQEVVADILHSFQLLFQYWAMALVPAVSVVYYHKIIESQAPEQEEVASQAPTIEQQPQDQDGMQP